MNEIARTSLITELEHLRQHGSSMSMLVITVRNTSNGLLAGIHNSKFSIYYPKAGWLDILRTKHFLSFCKQRGLPTRKEKWGTERVIMATVGVDSAKVADTIDECFYAVYRESGLYGVELHSYGWWPS